MLQSIAGKFQGKTSVVMLLVIVTGVACTASPAVAETLVWETDFARIHFNWEGTWDTTAYWAYGLYVLDIPDWAYMFCVYTMGWTDVWGPAFWGPDGVWGPEDKIDIHLQPGWSFPKVGGTGFVFDPSYFGSLDLEGGGWVNTMCTGGRTMAFYMMYHIMYQRYVANTVWVYDSEFLQKTLSYLVANVLWPWGDHVMVEGYDASTLTGIQAGYQHFFGTYPLTNGAHWYYWWNSEGSAANSLSPFHPIGTASSWGTALFNMFGAGYLFAYYDQAYLEGTGPSTGRIGTMLTWLRNDPDNNDFNGAIMAGYGHYGFQVHAQNFLDPKYGVIDAWMYALMWGYFWDCPYD